MAVYAIRGPEASSEAAMLDNLTALTNTPPPLHRHLLATLGMATRVPLSDESTVFPRDEVLRLIEETITEHSLNDDQADVLRSLLPWFQSPCTEPVRLVHGVFGAGKSHLLVVIILFLARLFTERASPLRVLVGTFELA